MKNTLLVLIALLILPGCGLQNQINDLKDRSDRNETDIDELKRRTAVLEHQMFATQEQLQSLDSALATQGANVSAQLAAITGSIAGLNAADANFTAQLGAVNTLIAGVQSDLSVLDGRVTAVEGDTMLLQFSVSTLQSDLAALQAQIATYVGQGTVAYNQIQAQIAALQGSVTVVQNSSTALNTNVTVLQSQMASTLVQLAILQGYTHIVAIKDPCGPQGAFNEVFLKLSDGTYLASFSENANGLNTRFTVLTDGSFRTTDGSNCYFTVSGGGTVISNEHN